MTKKEALLVLEHHQKWRRGGDNKMLKPKEIGKAIDVAIESLNTLVKNNNI